MTIEPIAGGDRPLELGDALVVAVEAEARGIRAGGEGDGELAAGAHVDREPLLGHPADHLGAEERLAGVVDARLHAVQRRGRAERVERAARVRADLVLVEDVERRAEALAQRRCGNAAEVDHAVVVAVRPPRPDARHEGIRVTRHGEPLGGQRAGGRNGGQRWDQSVGASAQPLRPTARVISMHGLRPHWIQRLGRWTHAPGSG